MTGDCPFCHMDDSRHLFGDEQVFAVWDGYPVSPGHLLIITRRHVTQWFEATWEEQQAILRALDQGRRMILEQRAVDGFNIGINVGVAAGQTVDHLHVHLIPRTEGDVSDPRGGVRHVIPARGNYLAAQPQPQLLHPLTSPTRRRRLVRGQDDPLLPHIRDSLDQALRADFAVAFILKSGVALLREHLRDLLDRQGCVRIVTGDYLDATDPDALVQLLDLGERLELRVFESQGTTFHPKAYIFHHSQGPGTAFVGSSNLTRPALWDGVEWNYRVLHEETDRGFAEIATAFDDLFQHPRTRPVDADWIDAYRVRRGPSQLVRVTHVVDEPLPPPPQPHSIQQEALAALRATRLDGNQAGLVVLATGLGKTWLAAFDSVGDSFRRILFVAHRDEILNQAMHTFRRIRPLARLGRYTGSEKNTDADVLFASIQTLGRARHLRQFPREWFDYIIVDEFHHAAARTYRQLIEYFTPQFLLGLTATPERTDGGDLLALCQENLVYRKDLISGIDSGLLCPFRYFGVPDEVDYANIPWRSTRFDELELTRAVATQSRAANAFEQYRLRAGNRGLGFCCSQRHADFMAEYFRHRGLRSAAVHSGNQSAPRASTLEALAAGQLDIVFAVDMFNEGLDLPQVDTILMLRPSESNIIWTQQFGRGLRRAEGKSELTVIDYIGNHRSFLVKVRSLLQPLLGMGDTDRDLASAIRRVQSGRVDLPAGCEVTYELETIQILNTLLRVRSREDAASSFFDDFFLQHGQRPTALEMYHAGHNPRSVRKTYGSWTRFLRAIGQLNGEESQAVETCGKFLDDLEATPMTKSFKMVVIEAMLRRDAFPGRIGIAELVEEFRLVISRSRKLRDDVGTRLDDDAALQRLVETNPIAAWRQGQGTGGRKYFQFENAEFTTIFSVSSEVREAFQNLTRELVDWRLAEYLDRGDSEVTTPS